ncbi:hypothetical protein HPP92_013854 [Vanilla planifolia]|uniref:Uncharacterized protein n=1 Tax=Vanilla planifolia TaxID=51239 RepID=A0A835QT20_VANPL|nr:hypothetical protein HPP92_013854 [Vanilla planifolia]
MGFFDPCGDDIRVHWTFADGIFHYTLPHGWCLPPRQWDARLTGRSDESREEIVNPGAGAEPCGTGPDFWEVTLEELTAYDGSNPKKPL